MKALCIFHKQNNHQAFNLDDHFRPILYELTSYIIEGGPVEEIPYILVPMGTSSAELNFGNFVGLASVCGKDFVVKSRKISEKHFNEMLTQITEEIANLPFDFNNPTFLPFQRSDPIHKDILYQQYTYLRHIILHSEPSLESGFRMIEANPHRSTLRIPCEEDISRFRGSKPHAIIDSYTRSENLFRLQKGDAAYKYPLAKELSWKSEYRVAPTIICDERVEATFDNPENRFLKSFLAGALLVAEHFHQAFSSFGRVGKAVDITRSIFEESKTIIRKLEEMLRSGFLYEVGEMKHFPSSSQVLQKREGYREIFMHYFKMALASQFPIDNESLKQIIEVKDIATLYEYWCFFMMSRILREKLGKPSRKDITWSDPFKKQLRHGMSIRFNKDIKLMFNKTYTGNSSSSYSVTLRPDISLECYGKLHLFDAKFKYETIRFEEHEFMDELEREEATSQTFKRGDIYKMHTYRDAITDARDVWILYPGNEFKFYEIGSGKIENIKDIEELDGVGAIPLKPLDKATYLGEVLERILQSSSG